MTQEIAKRNETAGGQLGFIIDAARTFDGIMRLSEMMAKCGSLPDHLRGKPGDCFRVVTQAAQWGMNPFAVADCTALVHGRLCYEGKLIHAVLQVTGAIQGSLDFRFEGQERSESRKIIVSGILPDGSVKTVSGTVADWRTVNLAKGDGRMSGKDISPWAKPGNWDRQLIYRGSREWARFWAPAALLGVITNDEAIEIREAEATVVETAPAEPVSRAAPAQGPAREPDPEPAADPAPCTVRDDGPGPATELTEADISKRVNAIVAKLGTAEAAKAKLSPLTVEFKVKRLVKCPAEDRPRLAARLDEIMTEIGAQL